MSGEDSGKWFAYFGKKAQNVIKLGNWIWKFFENFCVIVLTFQLVYQTSLEGQVLRMLMKN